MFPSKFLQFPSILTHFHAANEKIQNGGRDLAISRGLVWANTGPWSLTMIILLVIHPFLYRVFHLEHHPAMRMGTDTPMFQQLWTGGW